MFPAPNYLDAAEVASPIEEIAADAIAHFDPRRFWPKHAQDDEVPDDGNANLYIGPRASCARALDYLARSEPPRRATISARSCLSCWPAVRDQYELPLRLARVAAFQRHRRALNMMRLVRARPTRTSYNRTPGECRSPVYEPW